MSKSLQYLNQHFKFAILLRDSKQKHSQKDLKYRHIPQ